MDEGDVLGEVLRPFATVAAPAAGQVVRKGRNVVQKFVHEMAGNVLPRGFFEITDRAQVDGVAFRRS